MFFRICKEALATSLEVSVLSPPPTSSALASGTVDDTTLNSYEWLLKDAAATYNPIQQKKSLETKMIERLHVRRIHLPSMNRKASRTLAGIQLRMR